jgi:hypothetical protein
MAQPGDMGSRGRGLWTMDQGLARTMDSRRWRDGRGDGESLVRRYPFNVHRFWSGPTLYGLAMSDTDGRAESDKMSRSFLKWGACSQFLP